jgi:hypothetical protein
VNGRPPFEYFWADGNPDKLSISHLYFGDQAGEVWEFPYTMKGNEETPKRIK